MFFKSSILNNNLHTERSQTKQLIESLLINKFSNEKHFVKNQDFLDIDK